MIDLGNPKLSQSEREILAALLTLFGSDEPSLEQIWAAMDFVWRNLGCDNRSPNADMLARYYRHPVWLLNGLFVEQDEASLQHREEFSDWVRKQSPRRVADFGGGFGTLGRMIAAKCPDVEVHVVEPFPHQLALDRLASVPNASYHAKLYESYDVILATDVFEHVPDPLALVSDISRNLNVGGKFLIANCFYPVIACHLPQTFHFRSTWHAFMTRLGYALEGPVLHGWAYVKLGAGDDISALRKWEALSRIVFRYCEQRPALERLVGTLALKLAGLR